MTYLCTYARTMLRESFVADCQSRIKLQHRDACRGVFGTLSRGKTNFPCPRSWMMRVKFLKRRMDGWTRHSSGERNPRSRKGTRSFHIYIYIYIIRTKLVFSRRRRLAWVSKPISFELTESLEGTKLWIPLREYGLQRKRRRRRRRGVFATLIKDLTRGYNGGFTKEDLSIAFISHKKRAQQLLNPRGPRD